MYIKKITGTVLVAVMLSSGGFALAKQMNQKQKVANQDEREWLFEGTDPLSEDSYTENDSGTPVSESCAGGSTVCGIIAPANGDKPDLSDQGLQNRIQNPGNYDDVFFQP